MDNDYLLSVKHVSILLKVHQLTIRRYIKEGKLKALRAGGSIRIAKSSVDAFLQDVLPTSYSGKQSPAKVEVVSGITREDAIFRLKGRGLSLRSDNF